MTGAVDTLTAATAEAGDEELPASAAVTVTGATTSTRGEGEGTVTVASTTASIRVLGDDVLTAVFTTGEETTAVAAGSTVTKSMRGEGIAGGAATLIDAGAFTAGGGGGGMESSSTVAGDTGAESDSPNRSFTVSWGMTGAGGGGDGEDEDEDEEEEERVGEVTAAAAWSAMLCGEGVMMRASISLSV